QQWHDQGNFLFVEIGKFQQHGGFPDGLPQVSGNGLSPRRGTGFDRIGISSAGGMGLAGWKRNALCCTLSAPPEPALFRAPSR
ncbi:MAG: hypothetical protein KA535_05825, partial [Azonexus sp.]|nr:hypothetical protein [Azonexus sp.]